jgi:hypothetical protein
VAAVATFADGLGCVAVFKTSRQVSSWHGERVADTCCKSSKKGAQGNYECDDSHDCAVANDLFAQD